MIYLETLKSLSKTACYDFVMRGGIAVPNPVTTNMAKYHFAHNYHDVIKIVQDLAGGLVVTAPSYKDYQLPELQGYIDKYEYYNDLDPNVNDQRQANCSLVFRFRYRDFNTSFC